MRILKYLGLFLAGVIALVAILLLAVVLFVHPNDYKDRIARAVKESTGRELTLSGDIKLSVFPWIALELGPAQLGNPPGFKPEPLVAFSHAAVRVKLMPLLSKRLEIGHIDLDGLDVRLQRNAGGKGNWEDFGKESATPSKESSGGGQEFAGLAGVSVRNGRLSYQDLVIEKLNVTLGEFAEKRIVPVEFSFDVERGAQAARVSVAAKLNLTVDSSAKQYELAAVALHGNLRQASSARDIPWTLSLPTVALDMGAQSLAVPQFTAGLGGAVVSGAVKGTKIIDAMQLDGSFKLVPLDLKTFMPQWGLKRPEMRDPTALAQASAAGDFAYGKEGVRLDHLHLNLDQTQMQGKLAISDFKEFALNFDLAVDKIDVDRYLAPEKKQPVPAQKPFELPTAAMKGINANGTLTVGNARFSGMDFSGLRLTVSSKEGLVHLFPLQAKFDGGQYSGDVTLDSRAAVPAIKLDEHLTGIDMKQLLAATLKSERLSGHGNFNFKAVAHGATTNAILKSLTGRLDANLAGGAVEGMDLWFEVNRAQSLIKRQGLPAGSSSGRTKFDTFKASADLLNGVATTKDLVIVSQALKVTGQGSADLTSETIDYQVLASLAKTPTQSAVDIPVKITGTFADPKVRPDIEALAKGQLKQKVQDTVKGALQDKLKGLFGKP